MSFEDESNMSHHISHPVVTIKRGKDPEVQEVDIACQLQNVAATALKVNVSDKEPFKEGFDRPKKPKKLKSMTTKSTMTNEDDYTTAHTTTPCTTPTGSQNDRGILGNINDETIEVTNKIVGWKITPRVHFPPPNTVNASSLRTSEAKLREFPSKNARDFSSTIDPPYIHRPDRTLIVHQTRPMPLQPVKAWPGYGGNIYFHPFRIDTKPIGDRTYLDKSQGPRSNSAISGSRLARSQVETDLYSLSRFSSFYRSSPSLTSNKRLGQVSAKNESNYSRSQVNKQYPDKRHRQMARLDKNYVMSLQNNGRVMEDLSWISGMDALGTLKLRNSVDDVKRQSTNETYSRHTIIEKVPRNFIFHPRDYVNPESIVQPKIDQKSKSLSIRKYLKSYGIPDWALKQFVEKFYRDDHGRLRLPGIPLRVKGEKALVFNSNQ